MTTKPDVVRSPQTTSSNYVNKMLKFRNSWFSSENKFKTIKKITLNLD